MLKTLHGVSLVALAIVIATPSVAQDVVAPDEAGTDATRGGDFDTIVVTGRAGGTDLRKAEASFAVTTLSDDSLRLTNPVSAAVICELAGAARSAGVHS